jgi:dihydrofolate reductase
VHGSGALVHWLLDNDLVDEMNLPIVPVVVGQGSRLFPDTGPDTALDWSTRNPLQRGYRSRSTGPPGARSTRRPPPT